MKSKTSTHLMHVFEMAIVPLSATSDDLAQLDDAQHGETARLKMVEWFSKQLILAK